MKANMLNRLVWSLIRIGLHSPGAKKELPAILHQLITTENAKEIFTTEVLTTILGFDPYFLPAALSDIDILSEMEKGEIIIDPFDRVSLGPNSYDLHLAPFLGEYEDEYLSVVKSGTLKLYQIPEEGFVMYPGRFYLGATIEKTVSGKFFPHIDGKSSIGRLGILVHYTAGKGDVGFRGGWTLEMSVEKPTLVKAGMPSGQIYFTPSGKVEIPYDKKSTSKYSDQPCIPVASAMWKNNNYHYPHELAEKTIQILKERDTQFISAADVLHQQLASIPNFMELAGLK